MTANVKTDTDVLIIGAGLSGVNAAYRLQAELPEMRYEVFERRAEVGGTWDLFTYPGIRSDSDIFTLAFAHRPWTHNETVVGGAAIKNYIQATAIEAGILEKIKFNTYVREANWVPAENIWSVTYERGGTTSIIRARFVYFCTGYYNYDDGYTPDFPGISDFAGTVVHPQHWPADLDYVGKEVVVIGSGATAMTLVPAMAQRGGHITMLQRSPTYVLSRPPVERFTVFCQAILPAKYAHKAIRGRNAALTSAMYQACRKFPKLARKILTKRMKNGLPKHVPVAEHFNPNYAPWDERLCVIPNGDLFKAFENKSAAIVTDHIDKFEKDGIALKSGKKLPADIVITATGLVLQAFGGIKVTVAGQEFKMSERHIYKGWGLEGVPNLFWSFGYTNASWTLKADLNARAAVRLIKYMEERGYVSATPDPGSRVLDERPVMDLAAGYIQRAGDVMPKSATRRPWVMSHNYYGDIVSHHRDDITEDLTFNS